MFYLHKFSYNCNSEVFLLQLFSENIYEVVWEIADKEIESQHRTINLIETLKPVINHYWFFIHFPIVNTVSIQENLSFSQIFEDLQLPFPSWCVSFSSSISRSSIIANRSEPLIVTMSALLTSCHCYIYRKRLTVSCRMSLRHWFTF